MYNVYSVVIFDVVSDSMVVVMSDIMLNVVMSNAMLDLMSDVTCHLKFLVISPSGVLALPLAAGINVGGQYFGPSGVRALPLAAGINEDGHYFGPGVLRAPAEQLRWPLFLIY